MERSAHRIEGRGREPDDGRLRLLHGGGATGLARALQRHLRHLPVVMLHDRRLPDPAGVLEHLAVGPGGVTAIAGADALAGPLHVERVRGVFAARAELLVAAGRDATGAVAPVAAQVRALRELVEDVVPVAGALCLDDSGAPQLLHPLEVDGVLVGSPRAAAALAARPGGLPDTGLAALVELLCASCPPAL